MHIKLHANAVCTPAIRRYIRENRHLSTAFLQRELNLTRKTVLRWKNSEDGQDASSRPHSIETSFTDSQEALIVELRKTLLLPTDDLLAVVKRFIFPECSRSSLGRLLRRNGVSDLKSLLPESEEKEKKGKGFFKQYSPGYLHVDVKYLPKMPEERERGYLFVAIDRATRWVFMEIYPEKTSENAASFLQKLTQAFPGKIDKILTDNGKEFTDRFCANGERTPTGKHLVDVFCAESKIEHRLIKPRTPQTNGMVERFNGRIADLLARNRVGSARELRALLLNYRETYNNIIPQRALKHKTPNQALAEHFGFSTNLAGLDT